MFCLNKDKLLQKILKLLPFFSTFIGLKRKVLLSIRHRLAFLIVECKENEWFAGNLLSLSLNAKNHIAIHVK